jgi:hypothetical protein
LVKVDLVKLRDLLITKELLQLPLEQLQLVEGLLVHTTLLREQAAVVVAESLPLMNLLVLIEAVLLQETL